MSGDITKPRPCPLFPLLGVTGKLIMGSHAREIVLTSMQCRHDKAVYTIGLASKDHKWWSSPAQYSWYSCSRESTSRAFSGGLGPLFSLKDCHRKGVFPL